MRTIAKEADISTGPLYFHFKNKAEVFFHICNEGFDYLISHCHEAADQQLHAGLRLRSIYHAYKSFYYQEPQLFEIIHLPLNPMLGIDLPQPFTDILQQKSQELITIMAKVIEEGIAKQELRPVNPTHLALYLRSAAEGVFLSNQQGLLNSCQVSLDEMIDAAIEFIGIGMIALHRECPVSTPPTHC